VTTHRPLSRLIAAAIAALLLLAACGSDSGEPAAANEDATGDDSTEPAGSDDGGGDDASDNSDDAGGDDGDDADVADAPTGFADATYTTGTAQIEVSGDLDMNVDYANGGGYTEGEQMSLSFFAASSNDALGVFFQPGGSGGITWGTGQIAAGGEYPSDCDIELTTNDATEIAGSFECEDVPGINVAENITVTLEGTFSVKA
jgi:hypothetical protein